MSAFHVGRALAHEGLTPAEKLVLVSITYHANRKRGEVLWHSQTTIANELGMNKKTVREAYKKLEALGLISRTARKMDKVSGKNHRTTDLIQIELDGFTFPALEEQGRAVDIPAEVGVTDPQGAGEKSPGWGRLTPKGGGETPPLNHEINHEKTSKQPAGGQASSGTDQRAREDAMPVDLEEEEEAVEDMWSVPYVEPEAYSFVG